MRNDKNPTDGSSDVTMMTRREASRAFLVAIGGLVAVACSGGTTAPASDATDGGSSGTPGTDGAHAMPGSADSWASGGTAAMSGSYPDPYPTTAAACVLATAATEGPCTEAEDRERQDISEGYPGLPMRLALRVVDSACNPIAGAKVKIWHTQIAGSYSGDTPNNGMCLKESADSAKHYFRGVQTTDESGRVDFDSCFPGWYPGRTIHIHYTVASGGKSFTSQLVFDDTLVAEIFSSHPEYKGYGQPDTTNASDSVVGAQDLATYLVDATRASDGAMVAAKQLVVAVG